MQNKKDKKRGRLSKLRDVLYQFCLWAQQRS